MGIGRNNIFRPHINTYQSEYGKLTACMASSLITAVIFIYLLEISAMLIFKLMN